MQRLQCDRPPDLKEQKKKPQIFLFIYFFYCICCQPRHIWLWNFSIVQNLKKLCKVFQRIKQDC